MQRGHVVIGATVIGLAGLLAFDQVQFGNPFALRNDNATRVLAAGTSAAGKVAGAQSATGVAVPNQYGSVQVPIIGWKKTSSKGLAYVSAVAQPPRDWVPPVTAQSAAQSLAKATDGVVSEITEADLF